MPSRAYKIKFDNSNDIPASVKDRRIEKIDVEPCTLGPITNEDGDWEKSKNHWAIILQCQGGNVRLSMESAYNDRTGKYGLLSLKELSYAGQSWRALASFQYEWLKNEEVKVRTVLDFIIAEGYHMFEMVQVDPEGKGGFKGCRHWV
jgi:hypothetical protein